MNINRVTIAALLLLSSSQGAFTSSSTNAQKLIHETKSGSVSDTDTPLNFGPSVFYATNYFYLGSNNTNQEAYSFVRTYFAPVTQICPTAYSLEFKPLAPAKAFVNASQKECVKASNKKDNPLYNAEIAQVAMMGQYPLAVLETKNPANTDANILDDRKNITLLIDTTKGEFVLTNTAQINDAKGDPTGGIAGIAGSATRIFAAVNETGNTNFTGDYAGIAIVKSTGINLEPTNAVTGKTGNQAVNVKMASSEDSDSGHLGRIRLQGPVTLHWDEVLERLFVGLVGDVQGLFGTFFSGVLVGRMDGSKLILEPIVAKSVIGNSDTPDKIVAYYESVTTIIKRAVAIHHVKTMHTSTGKSYIIVNGNIDETPNDTKNEVLALPIIRQQYSDSDFAKSKEKNKLIGKLADKTSVSQEDAPTVVGDLFTQGDTQTHVGGSDGSSFRETPANVENMFVVGDAVYVCCNGGDAQSNGIFQSSAIFGANGLIRAWTPWQRVMGSTDNVKNAAIDLTSCNFWYLTETNAEWDTVKVTNWGKRDSNLLGRLRAKLDTEFSQATGGIHQLFNFDEFTASFDEEDFSMIVATGYQKVALIQTGKDDGGDFVPTLGNDFSDANIDDFVQVFNGQALQDIGPICCAAVSRSTGLDDGWLFVGGYGGVAVLSQDTGGDDGAGWNNIANLTEIDADYSFKEIGDFKNVLKLACDDTYLYVLTPNALYRIDLSEGKFEHTTPDALGEETIAEPTYENLTSCSACDTFLDFIVTGKMGLLATTAGLYRTANGQDIQSGTLADAQSWTEVTPLSGYSLGPVTHLSTKSLTKGSFNTGGNLYVVAANMSTDLAAVVRFNVVDPEGAPLTDATVVPIVERKVESTSPTREQFYAFGELRTAFMTDGSFGYHILPKHFGQTSYGKKVNMVSTQFGLRTKDAVVPLALERTAYNVGIPVQNTASGAWIFPGDWGTRINE